MEGEWMWVSAVLEGRREKKSSKEVVLGFMCKG